MRITDANIFLSNTVFHNSVTPSASKFESVPNSTSGKIMQSTVSISGEAHMRYRLFHSDDLNYKLPLKTPDPLRFSLEPDVNFLTQDDRVLLGQIYEYAQDQSADLGYADELGRGLAAHRANEKFMNPHNRGQELDGEGHMLSYSFTDKDAVIAKRVLASEAIKTTRLDHGFIRKAMDKDYGSTRHHNFEFMEKVINKFSAKVDDSQLGVTFAKHAYIDRNFVQHASKERYRFTTKGAELIGSLGKEKEEGKEKAGDLKQPNFATPATLKDILRQIIFNAIGSSKRNGLPSLADYLMRNRQ